MISVGRSDPGRKDWRRLLQQCETHRFGKYGKNIRNVTQLYAALTKSNNTAKQDIQTPTLESHQSN